MNKLSCWIDYPTKHFDTLFRLQIDLRHYKHKRIRLIDNNSCVTRYGFIQKKLHHVIHIYLEEGLYSFNIQSGAFKKLHCHI